MNDSTLVASFDAVLLDLDGVVYLGSQSIAHAADVINSLAAQGVKRAFVTNNSSRTPGQVAAHLQQVGVDAQPADVIGSAQAAAVYLAGKIPADSPVFIVGGQGLVEAVTESGLRPTRSMDDNAVAVVQGFHPDVGWRDLANASYLVADGAFWVASNMDMTLPTEQGLAPGNGSLVTSVATASGGTPVVVGKPYPPTITEAMKRLEVTSALVVGDRLDTDIEAAHRSNLPSLLVLTGVTQVADVCVAPERQRPTFIGRDLRVLEETYLAAEVDGSAVTLADWHFKVDDSKSVILQRRGKDAELGIRALAAACWLVAGFELDATTVQLANELQQQI